MLGEEAIKLLETAVQFSEVQLVDIVDQFLNFMIFTNVMAALRSIAIVFIGWILLRAIRAVIKVLKEDKKFFAIVFWDFTRALVIVATVGFSIWLAYTPMITIAKILIAPKVYLLEEGADFVKKYKK